ncbi:MAG: DUF1489 family protein, partial [Hyphomicrobiales bacterium]|nr:DUF1489 family protein [Hyphomicrobiales bacterium]
MPLHLVKLCVGATDVADLRAWMAERATTDRKAGGPGLGVHVTRMAPKRAAELLDGGSLYWVIRGFVSARQRLVAIETFVDGEGIGRCRLKLDPEVVVVAGGPCRPFQGWRYLAASSAPADLGAGGVP